MRAVNLLPKDDGRGGRKGIARRHQIALAVGVLAIALLAVGAVLTGKTASREQSKLDALRTELAATPPPPPPKPSASAKLKPLLTEQAQRADAVSAAVAHRIAWDQIVRQIVAVVPKGVHVTGMNLAASGPGSQPPSGAPASAGSFSLSGSTVSQDGVALLLTRLALVPYLTDIQLKSSAGAGPVTFSIAAGIQLAGGSS